MNNNMETPTKFRQSEVVQGQHLNALTDPNESEFRKLLEKSSGKTILDIGSGSNPILSWEPERGGLWVGCDPSINKPESGRAVQVHKSDMEIQTGSNFIIFTRPVDEVPKFSPDYISAVAPNPKDVVDGKIFNEDLKKFLSDKTQYFVVVLDDRTFQSKDYGKDAREIIEKWMEDNDFIGPEMDDYIDDSFEPNSADLNGTEEIMCFRRN